MKIFITGGTGFLGQRVIRRLRQEYSDISGLARSSGSSKMLEALAVNPVLGSLENIDQWKDGLSGVDVVIHCAAPVEFWGSWDKYQKGIVEATEALFLAAEREGVKRFIFVSSESVLQDRKDLMDIDESEPYPESPNSFYGKAKMLAEQFILARNSPMESIIIRPTFIWGKGVKALDTLIEKVKSGGFMWIGHGKSFFEMVHVDNAAEAIALACVKGTHRNVYFVTDGNPQPVKVFLTKLLATRGIVPPEKSIPKGIAEMLAGMVENVWRTFNIRTYPPITRFDLAFVAMGRKYRIDKIKKDLGYEPVVSEQDGLKAMSMGNGA